MADAKPIPVSRLITIPATITLAVTILRLAGELKHWPGTWFSAAAGEGPRSAGKAIGFALLGLVAFLLVAGVLLQLTLRHPSLLTLAMFPVMLVTGFVPLAGWKSLGNTLLAYALAARIPVLIVMYSAMSGKGGAGWGTHYDAVAPMLAHLPLGRKYLYAAIVPQLTLWIAWTVILGAIFGTTVAAIARRGKPPAPASE